MRFLLVGLALVLASCATPVATYSPISRVAGDVTYDKNQPITVSNGERSRVIVSAPSGAVASERPVFFLLIANNGSEPVTIGVDSVSARTSAGRVLRVISPEQLELEARQQAFRIRLAAALQAAGNSMQAANAGYSSSSGTYSGSASAYGTGGSAYGNYSGTYTGTQYNAAAAAQAQAAANAANAQISQSADQQAGVVLANSQVGALQRQTIFAGQYFTTPVTIERLPRNAGEVILIVEVSGEVHQFRWNYSQQ